MSKLAHWTYCSFREDGQFLKDIEARAAAERLVKELDKDGDGNISFKEFVEYFEMKEKEAQSYHDSVLKTSGDHTNAHNYFSEDETFVMPPMSAAYTKFLELDDDKSGELSVEELQDLAEWVYNTFSDHDDLTPDQVTQHIYANYLFNLCKFDAALCIDRLS